MDWLQISFQIEKPQAELISEVLTGLGCLSITYSDTFDDAIYEPSVGQMPLWDNVTVNALFSTEVDQEDIKASIFEICNVNALTSFILKDKVWEDECKKDFHSMKFGENLWVCPSWESQAELPSDAIIINMDPGLAFGTGSHQTTSLCLEYLDNNPPKNIDVIDFGCGSGILAIAAAKLGALRVLAIDNDPQAVISSKDNIINNQCERIIKTIHSKDEIDFEGCDLLIANILTNPLIKLAPTFADLVNPDGEILLSGILKKQVDRVVGCYSEYFTNFEVSNIDEWYRVTGTRTA